MIINRMSCYGKPHDFTNCMLTSQLAATFEGETMAHFSYAGISAGSIRAGIYDLKLISEYFLALQLNRIRYV